MSESTQLPPDPLPESRDAEASPTDPLLDGGSYIEPGRNDSGAAGTESAPDLSHHHPNGNPEFAPGVAIAAVPISVYVPGETTEDSAEATPRPPWRRNPDEMSKRPSWLPEDWEIELRVRSAGATAGQIDRYYVEPMGQRRFRSRVEVLRFLESGSNPPKRKSTAETDTEPSSATQKQMKSNTKRKKSEAFDSNNTQPPRVLNGIKADKDLIL